MQPVIEAILYTAGEAGVGLIEFAQLLNISPAAMRQQLATFGQGLADDASRGLMLQSADDRYYLLTKPEYADALKQYFAGPPHTGLSNAALEVLAIIAYQQPITRLEIDDVRGVQSSGALTTLASRQLIKEAGRKDAPGRPILYATTPFFLDYFGLHTLDDLPPLDEAKADPTEVDLFTDFRHTLPDSGEDDAEAAPSESADAATEATDAKSEEGSNHAK
ncbi:SMC-Scp complex subunit ScpB [Lacticaseibacillus hegangensis]|uniref:Segregation and condensation protein B n=1 Tax=Lacticaseibacillus hegangensis TaxID=2486010 RepID=A0ABW4CZS0_9LACO|nr:SMC-Scp complex subunit ScpB [Lacticaseibacillus hegangensis]